MGRGLNTVTHEQRSFFFKVDDLEGRWGGDGSGFGARCFAFLKREAVPRFLFLVVRSGPVVTLRARVCFLLAAGVVLSASWSGVSDWEYGAFDSAFARAGRILRRE